MSGHKRIRHGHLRIEHCDKHVPRNSGRTIKCEQDVEFVGEVIAEQETRREDTPQPTRSLCQAREFVQQFGGTVRRRKCTGHGGVGPVERTAVPRHSGGEGTQSGAVADHQVCEHLVI
jgi:hypothetical protein